MYFGEFLFLSFANIKLNYIKHAADFSVLLTVIYEKSFYTDYIESEVCYQSTPISITLSISRAGNVISHRHWRLLLNYSS